MGEIALDGPDDVAPLAHATQSRVRLRRNPPDAGLQFTGKAEPLERSQPSHA